ncbi:hypothetical protein [Devosia sp. A449]
MTPEDRRTLIISVGMTLYGERYGAPLARGLKVDQSLIVRIVNRERNATDLLMLQLADLLAREWKQRLEEMNLIERLVKQVTGHSLEEHLDQLAHTSTPDTEDQGDNS